MSHLPTGTVTFLFTDIEASTRLLQQLGDVRSQQAFADHERLLCDAVRAVGGHVYEDQGESFLFVFERARDAVLAAVTAQRALSTHRWLEGAALRVRMGLHTGEPVSTGEVYVGVDVHRVARIGQAGYGGQVLLSQTTRELVAGDLPDGVSLQDLGEHRLKDLARPQRLFQVVIPDVPRDFPPLKSLDILPNNLPVQLTSFVGREREIAEVNRLLSGTRLLTLTGVGGVGKTRLAMQVAAQVLDEFGDGVWSVELASLSDPAFIPQTVASALGVREVPGRSIMETLIDFVQPKHLLLVLDNAEHLIEPCAQLANGILRSCPDARILATSREGLAIAGETVWRVPPLLLPDPRHLPPADKLMEFEAIRLFVERAQAMLPAFKLTNRNALAVARICHQLDGLPLALELAAARVRVLSVEQIAVRLDDRFRLLRGDSRTALPRHQTLRAALDWSYDLLSEKERILLRRLSVFAGGWTLEAAQAVCSGETVEAQEVLDVLASLFDKSLVAADAQGTEARYHLLETVRQYGRDRLREAGDAERLHGRHCDYFLKLAEEAEPHFRGVYQTRWLNRLETEHDNLRAALDWSRTDRGGTDKQLRLAGALWRFWSLRGYFSDGRSWLEGALAESSGASASVRAKALHGAGYLAFRLDEFTQAKAWLEQAVALYRETGDTVSLAFSLASLGSVARERGDYERSVTFLEEGLALARKLEDKWGIARALGNLGVVEEFRGNYVRATQLFEESHAVSRETGDRFGIAYALEHLGAVTAAQGHYRKAREFLEGAMTLLQELGDKAHVAYTHYELGVTAWLERDYGRAKQSLEEGLALCREVGDRNRIARCLEGLAGVAVEEDQPNRAALLCGAAEALREVIAVPLTPASRAGYERTAEAARAALGHAAFEAAIAEGHRMTLEQVVEYALSGLA